MDASPLAEVWPVFDPDEKFGRYSPHSSIAGLLGIDNSIRIRVLKRCTINYADFEQGSEMTVMRHEVARLLKHRMVEEI